MIPKREMHSMTSAGYVDQARNWGRTLEDREATRMGQPIKYARVSVARKTGVPASTLENLRNGRLKAVAAHVYNLLWLAVQRELAAEIKRLEQNLLDHHRVNRGPAPGEAAEIMADLARLRARLKPHDGAAA